MIQLPKVLTVVRWLFFIPLLSSCIYLGPNEVTGIGDEVDIYLSSLNRIGNIAYIRNNEVHLLDLATNESQMLTSDGTTKTKIALSHSKDRIAYLTANSKMVVVISAENGNEINRHTTINSIKTIGFGANNLLYYFHGTTLSFDGDASNVPEFRKETSIDRLKDAFLSKNNDVAYVYETPRGFSRFNRLRIRFSDSSKEEIFHDRRSFEDILQAGFSQNCEYFQYRSELSSLVDPDYYKWNIGNDFVFLDDDYYESHLLYENEGETEEISCRWDEDLDSYNFYITHKPRYAYSDFITEFTDVTTLIEFDYKY